MQGLPYRLQTWLLAECFTHLLRRESLRTREPGFIVLNINMERLPVEIVIWFRPKPQNSERCRMNSSSDAQSCE